MPPGDILGWTALKTIRSAGGETYGGGNFVTRADGKVLVAYTWREETSVTNVMLSVVDTEADLFLSDNEVVTNEWEFTSVVAAGGDLARLHHAPNGDLLLFVLNPRRSGGTGDAWVRVYRSDNRLGTDFVLLASAWVLNPSSPVSAQVDSCRLGQAVNSDGRIIMACTLAWRGSSGNNWLPATYVIRSDDDGATWASSRLSSESGQSGCRGIGVFSNGLFLAHRVSGGDIITRRSSDNGSSWSLYHDEDNGASEGTRANRNAAYFVAGDYTYLVAPDASPADNADHKVYRAPTSATLPADPLDKTTFWEEVGGPFDLSFSYTMHETESGEYLAFLGPSSASFQMYGGEIEQAIPEEPTDHGGAPLPVPGANLAHVIVAPDGRACYPIVGGWEFEENTSGGQIGGGGRVAQDFYSRYRDVLQGGAEWWTYIRETGEVRTWGILKDPSVNGKGVVDLSCYGAAGLAEEETGRWFFGHFGPTGWVEMSDKPHSYSGHKRIDVEPTKTALKHTVSAEPGSDIGFEAEADDDVFTANGHKLKDGTAVRIRDDKGTTLPGGVNQGPTYFVRDRTPNTFKLAATSGGAAIDVTGDGAGSVYTVPYFEGGERDGLLYMTYAELQSRFEFTLDKDDDYDDWEYVLYGVNIADDGFGSALTEITTWDLGAATDDGDDLSADFNGYDAIVLALRCTGAHTVTDKVRVKAQEPRVYGRSSDEDTSTSDVIRNLLGEIGVDDDGVQETDIPAMPLDMTGTRGDVLRYEAILSGRPIVLCKEGLRTISDFSPPDDQVWMPCDPEMVENLEDLPLYNHVLIVTREIDGEVKSFVEAFDEDSPLDRRVTLELQLTNPGTRALAQNLADVLIPIVGKPRVMGDIATSRLADHNGVRWPALSARVGHSFYFPQRGLTQAFDKIDLNDSLPVFHFADPMVAMIERFNNKQDRKLAIRGR